MKANLVEIFRSFQGEGVHVGRPTVFVRFGGCDLRCGWCDSPHTWLRGKQCRVEIEAGSGRFRTIPNDVALGEVEAAVSALAPDSRVAVSLTGGEPLLQGPAVGHLAARFAASGRPVHLETHGLAVEALDEVVDHCAVVAMDWKLASDVRRDSDPSSGPVDPYHDRHAAFLSRVWESRATAFVKVVVTRATRDDELSEVCERISRIDRAIPLVLQPVTPFGRVKESPCVTNLLAITERCESKLENVRIIPQTHRSYGAL